MKVIIAGSRTITKYKEVEKSIKHALFRFRGEITEVVSGGAKGVDKCGEQYAKKNKIPFIRFEANWREFGRAAGPMRNKKMAEYADALIAIWDGRSRGTRNMIDLAIEKNLQYFVYVYEGGCDE
jgi:hypothetical protein